MRKEISQKEHIPAYMIFSDATLKEMAERRPVEIEQISEVSGVGEVKLAKYGRQFLGVIRKFQGMKRTMPAGTSQKESLLLLNSGMEPEKIAEIKGVAISTVYSHFAQLAEDGNFNDFRKLLTHSQYKTVIDVFDKDPDNAYQILKEKHGIDSYIARIAIAERNYHLSQ